MKKRNLFTKNAQTKTAPSAWWGKRDINNSVIKSKKRKIKISDIYTCDKRRRVRGEINGFWDSAMFDSSRRVQLLPHLFIATESQTALSVTRPAESIKHAGWTLYNKESRMWPAVTGRTRSWEAAGRETLVGKNEERSPLSSYEINVNVLNEVGFKKDQGSSELLTYV